MVNGGKWGQVVVNKQYRRDIESKEKNKDVGSFFV